MKIVAFTAIKHLLPQDIFYLKDEYWDSQKILFHEGDWVWDTPLDLDNVKDLLPDGSSLDFPPFILVTGNMVAQNIFNDETDGATGLVVLGNLTAHNIAVGGQLIHVAGNLKVSGLYWGDYNHGELAVQGKNRNESLSQYRLWL